MIVVADTFPLLHLARIGRLDLIVSAVGPVIAPRTVWSELIQSGTHDLPRSGESRVRPEEEERTILSLTLPQMFVGLALVVLSYFMKGGHLWAPELTRDIGLVLGPFVLFALLLECALSRALNRRRASGSAAQRLN